MYTNLFIHKYTCTYLLRRVVRHVSGPRSVGEWPSVVSSSSDDDALVRSSNRQQCLRGMNREVRTVVFTGRNASDYTPWPDTAVMIALEPPRSRNDDLLRGRYLLSNGSDAWFRYVFYWGLAGAASETFQGGGRCFLAITKLQRCLKHVNKLNDRNWVSTDNSCYPN